MYSESVITVKIIPNRCNRITTRSGGILFHLKGIIFTVMTGSLYIIPLITRLNISQINNTIALSERSAQILISDVFLRSGSCCGSSDWSDICPSHRHDPPTFRPAWERSWTALLKLWCVYRLESPAALLIWLISRQYSRKLGSDRSDRSERRL